MVIPAAFRKAMGIEVGDEILLQIEDDELRITTQQRRIRRAQRRARRYLKSGLAGRGAAFGAARGGQE